MRTFLLIALVLVGIITNAQTQNINNLIIKDSIFYSDSIIYTGFFSSFYRNGKIKEYGYIENGKIDSILTKYDKKGYTLLISQLENGELIHQTIFYPSTNNIKRKVSIIDGKEDGVCANYYSNGYLQDSGYYANGKRVGKWTYWNEAGKKNYEITNHGDCLERTDYIYSNDTSYSKTVFFDKYGRKIKK